MYATFNLKLSFKDFEDYTDLLHTGQQHKLQLQKETKKELDRFILTEDIIDGSSLSEKWFGTTRPRVRDSALRPLKLLVYQRFQPLTQGVLCLKFRQVTNFSKT